MVFNKKTPIVEKNSVNKSDKTETKEDLKDIKDKNIEQTKNDNDINVNVLDNTINELESKNKELEKKIIYLAAEYENLKKRTSKEIEDTSKFAVTKFVEDVLKVYDILLTGIDNTKKENNDEVFFNGVKMTINEFEKMFEKMQIKKILPNVGDKFDHNKHEAISKVQSDIDSGCVYQVIRCGYEFYGRLLRPAMVVVSVGE